MKRGSFLLLMGKKRFARNRQCGFGKNGNIQWNRKSRRFRKTPFAQGDVLVLGLNSDESVKRQGKGDDRPVNPYPVRAFVLAHLESVDFVVRFDEDTPAKLIEAVQPDVLVKGGDWSVDRIVGRESVQRRGGEVISLPLLQGYSTTALIEKIRRTAPGSR